MSLINERSTFEEQYNLLCEKIQHLRKDSAIETDSATKFKLERQIKEVERELEKIAPKLQYAENREGQGTNKALSCFVIMPIREQFKNLFRYVIEPTCDKLGIATRHMGSLRGTPKIDSKIWENIVEADFTIADITGNDSNVMYEIGLCHATDTPVILFASPLDYKAPFDIANIRQIRYSADLDDSEKDRLRQELAETIIGTLADSKAGDVWKFHKRGFGHLKHIREIYSNDEKKLSFACKCYKYVEDDLLCQIEDHTLKFPELDFDKIGDVFVEFLEEGDLIYATCFSNMSDFYFKRGIGDHYFKLNLRAMKEKNIKIYRIFGVKESWEFENIPLRDLIRLYQMFDNTEIKVVFDKDIDKKDDFFLICDKKGKPKGVLDFITDEGIIKSVVYNLSTVKLDNKKAYFMKIQNIADSVEDIDGFPKMQSKFDKTEWSSKYIEKFSRSISKEIDNTNLISYIKSPSKNPDDIADYWERLKGSLIRPPESCVKELDRRLSELVDLNNGGRVDKVLVLGCSPESRMIASKYSKEVYVADISKAMYSGMKAYIEKYFSNKYSEQSKRYLKKENFLLIDWRSIGSVGLKCDCVIGIDVLNMIPSNELKQIYGELFNCLKDNGKIITQRVNRPGNDYMKICRASVPGNPADISQVYQKHRDSYSKEKISLHELFARICFSQTKSNVGQFVKIGDIVDFLENLPREGDGVGRKLYENYYQCNTTLYLHNWAQIESKFSFGFDLGTDANPCTELNSFQRLFSIVTLVKK